LKPVVARPPNTPRRLRFAAILIAGALACPVAPLGVAGDRTLRKIRPARSEADKRAARVLKTLRSLLGLPDPTTEPGDVQLSNSPRENQVATSSWRIDRAGREFSVDVLIPESKANLLEIERFALQGQVDSGSATPEEAAAELAASEKLAPGQVRYVDYVEQVPLNLVELALTRELPATDALAFLRARHLVAEAHQHPHAPSVVAMRLGALRTVSGFSVGPGKRIRPAPLPHFAKHHLAQLTALRGARPRLISEVGRAHSFVDGVTPVEWNLSLWSLAREAIYLDVPLAEVEVVVHTRGEARADLFARTYGLSEFARETGPIGPEIRLSGRLSDLLRPGSLSEISPGIRRIRQALPGVSELALMTTLDALQGRTRATFDLHLPGERAPLNVQFVRLGQSIDEELTAALSRLAPPDEASQARFREALPDIVRYYRDRTGWSFEYKFRFFTDDIARNSIDMIIDGGLEPLLHRPDLTREDLARTLLGAYDLAHDQLAGRPERLAMTVSSALLDSRRLAPMIGWLRTQFGLNAVTAVGTQAGREERRFLILDAAAAERLRAEVAKLGAEPRFRWDRGELEYRRVRAYPFNF
jgi:hypothetical protein